MLANLTMTPAIMVTPRTIVISFQPRIHLNRIMRIAFGLLHWRHTVIGATFNYMKSYLVRHFSQKDHAMP